MGACSPALTKLDAWCAAYLSTHAVRRHLVPGAMDKYELTCTCPGFWSEGVCWHVTHQRLHVQESSDAAVAEDEEGGISDHGDGICVPEENAESEEKMEDSPVPEDILGSAHEDLDQAISASGEVCCEEAPPANTAGGASSSVGRAFLPISFAIPAHGPVNSAALSQALAALERLGVHKNRPRDPPYLGRWTLERAKSGRSRCKGCGSVIMQDCSRLHWAPADFLGPSFRHHTGGSAGFWHLSCAVIMSKAAPSANVLTPLTSDVVRTFRTASADDAAVLSALAAEPLVFLRAHFRV